MSDSGNMIWQLIDRETGAVNRSSVLLRAAETVNILLDVSHPGLSMAHCHTAEHDQTA